MKVSVERIFSTHLSKTGNPAFFFDVDGTIKDSSSKAFPKRFHPALPSLLVHLQNFGSVGINTDQSAKEFQRFKLKMEEELTGRTSVLTGPYLLEGGHVRTCSIGAPSEQHTKLIDQGTVNEIASIYQLVVSIVVHIDQWTQIPSLPTRIMLPTSEDQGVVAKAIYEQGPSINDTTYKGEYVAVQKWIQGLALAHHLLQLAELVESGNGTLRIVGKNVNKGSILQSVTDHGITLSQVIYSGDQINDAPAMKIVKDHGGLVILPANADPSLHQYADIIASQNESSGIVEVFSNLQ